MEVNKILIRKSALLMNICRYDSNEYGGNDWSSEIQITACSNLVVSADIVSVYHVE
jgi:hypothetical protein